MIPEMPAEDFSRININHCCHIPEPGAEQDIRKITSSQDVRSDGTEDFCDVFDPCFRPSKVIWLHETEASPELWFEMELLHESVCFLAVHAKSNPNPSMTICRMFFHDGHNLCFVLIIRERFFRFVVQGRAGDAKLLSQSDFRSFSRSHIATDLNDFFPPASFQEQRGR